MHPTWSILKVPDKNHGKDAYCLGHILLQFCCITNSVDLNNHFLLWWLSRSRSTCVSTGELCADLFCVFPILLGSAGWPELALLRLKSLSRKHERLLNAWLGIGTQLLLPSALGRGRSHIPGQSQEPPTRSPCTEELTSGASESIYYKG